MTAAEKEEKFSRTIWKAQYTVSILGNVHSGEFELIDADKLPLSEESVQNFRQRNFVFLGVIGLHEDGPRMALECELSGETIRSLSVRFLKQLERELNARVTEQIAKSLGDSLEWLNQLHRLPDIRNGMEN